MGNTLLLVAADKQTLRALRHRLHHDSYDILTADSGKECLRLLTEREAQVVIASRDLPDMDGQALLGRIRESRPEAVQLLLTEAGDQEVHSGNGSHFSLCHSWPEERMRSRIQEAFSFHELIRTNGHLSRFLSDPAAGVVITDPHWIVQATSPAFSRLSGFGAGELFGKDVRGFVAARCIARFEGDIHPELLRTGQWHGEVVQRGRDGTEVPRAMSIHAVKNGAGEISLLIFSFCAGGGEVAERGMATENVSYFDRLTKLPNRLLFSDRLNMALAQARRNGNMVGVILLDIDRFKIINDTLGYTTGDEVLREVAGRLSAHTRQEDTVSRLSGDEFVLLMPRLSQIEDAVTFSRKLLSVFKRPFAVNGHDLNVSPSIGISIYPDNGSRAETLIKNADTAMGWSKEQGGNCYCFYTPTMQVTAFRRLTLVNNLHRALEQNQFVLHFQPQVDLATGRIIGAESLVRWQSPELGMVPPSQFIPAAEESGLIVDLGAWALHSACSQARRWFDQGHTTFRVAVNLSARLFGQEALLNTIQEVLAESGLPPFCLEVEITESILMQNAPVTAAILDRFKAMGIRISMDDFGTGYSSLSYLKRFPIDTLKIDQSFVRDVTVNPDDAAIVTAIIAMANSLNLRVLAEGVETGEQAAFLRELGCHTAQGYLISHPVPAMEFERMLAAQKDRGQLSIPMI